MPGDAERSACLPPVAPAGAQLPASSTASAAAPRRGGSRAAGEPPTHLIETRIEHPEPCATDVVRVRAAPGPIGAREQTTWIAHDAPANTNEPTLAEPCQEEVTREHDGRYVYAGAEVELGRGGIGRVLLATDRHLGREVAIKQLLPATVEEGGSQLADAETRFVREARICGQLEHPNIVPVYELGRRRDGRLYYTMKVIRGRTLESAIAGARTLAERLALLGHFSGLCQAIAFAHSQNVVHRDIKPENVMIGEFGETVVLDWGGAKVRGERESRIGAQLAELEHNPRRTAAGTWVGTPLYMSPEQALGEVDEIDERSDVWSLGVVLYQLLTGRPPFAAATMAELVPQIVDEEPPPVAAVAPEVPPALAAIVERALQKAPHQRYPSARSMWLDIEAFRSGELVASYSYSSFELLARFVSRHRASVGVALVGLLVLFVTAVASYQRVTHARDQALNAERRALENERQARRNLADVFAMQATVAADQADPIAATVFAGRALELEERPDARGIVLGNTNRMRWVPEPPLARDCELAVVSHDAQRWVCAAGNLTYFDGSRRTVLERSTHGPITDLLISPNGHALLVQAPHHIEVWDLRTHSMTRHDFGSAAVTALALDERGQHWAVGTHDGEVLLYRGLERLLALSWSQPVSQLFLTGERLFIGGRFGQLQSISHSPHDAASVEFKGHTGTITALAVSPDRRYLASSSADRSVRLWPLRRRAGEVSASRTVAAEMSTALAFSSDGQQLAQAAPDYSIRVYNLRTRRSWLRLRAHDTPVQRLRFTRDGRLFSSSSDIPLQPWAQLTNGTPSQLVDTGNVVALAALPNGRALFTAGLSKPGICWWSLDAEACTTRFPVSAEVVRSMDISNTGRYLAVAGSGGFAMLWNLESKLPTTVLTGHRDDVRSVEFSPDGRRVLTASLDGSVREWDVPKGSTRRALPLPAGAYVARYAPHDEQIAVGLQSGVVTFYDAASKPTHRHQAHSDWVMDLSFLADQAAYITAGADRRLALWDLSDHTLTAEALGFSGRVLSVASSPDGKWIAAASEEPLVRLFDAKLRLVAELRDHWATVRVVRFTPDSRFLITAGDDRRARLWPLHALGTNGRQLVHSLLREQRLILQGNQLAHQRP